MQNKTFQIAVPTDDDGFIGRACDNPECGQYFKVFLANHQEHLHCPYCGNRFHKSALFTQEQMHHVKKATIEELRALALNDLQKAFRGIASSSHGSGDSITYKPGRPYRKKTIRPSYSERDTDSELQCPTCDTRFRVHGIFGYCPGCREENLQIYDANWAIIKRDIHSASDQQRALRHAYSDFVSAFENFCKRKATSINKEPCNFQVLFDARKFFKVHVGVDFLDGISVADLLALRRVFQKRHVCNHSGGVITDRYVRQIPEDSRLLNQQVVLELHELETAARALRVGFAKLVQVTERRG